MGPSWLDPWTTRAPGWLVRLPLAQAGDLFEGPVSGLPGSGDGGGSVMAIKWVCFGSIALLAFFLCYFGVFSWLLKKNRPAWPRDAYGYVSALFFTILGLAGLLLFWDNLVLDRIAPSLIVENNFLRDWAARTILLALTLVIGALFVFFYRSRYRPA